ncbi:MAG: ABC transporter ATP-binding protein [Sphaerochaetaceae bacterium]|jgi:iron(III) transport system ATP-binding protein|nr:ABC transporter ATP-binding protein [Sphaerochaetaceae bacterium]MDD3941956.1 ABC transporter ATP-binding protein [Sphaerochaetaceae bacterium]MDX9939208.1 ABC transporter ATP-binding protein [Sphaerochaetaceae bacterium]
MQITITGLKKHYHSEGKTIRALDGVNLTIEANKIFTLLGPSGCGKTTLLRCIVGLETPDEGEIKIGDTIVWSNEKNIYVPTEKRELGMVFQTYAIWPHMNVFNNVAYPLQNMKMPKDEIAKRVAKTLKFVQLEGFENRPATRLSGGQQQRVALARALVAEPKVILFDEPLSNLDAKLREETRKELRMFLGELGITAVYVTHDRVEALALSDMIGVMRAGNIVELGTPKKIYFDADHQFVADFIGRANLIPAKVTEETSEHSLVTTAIGSVVCQKRSFDPSDELTLCIRPEFLDFKPASDAINRITGVVEQMVFVGEVYESEIRVGTELIFAKLDPQTTLKEGDHVTFSMKPEHCLLVSR